MSASQARLLSITARLSDNENTAQSVSYSKQRLADQTEQLNQSYNDAQNATKLTVITGYSNSTPTYTDISYGLLTDASMKSGKQYAITDTQGRMLVTEDVASAYEAGNGDLNIFLAKMGYSQSTNTTDYDATKLAAKDSDQEAAVTAIHEAWDKYYDTLGVNLGDDNHDIDGVLTFGYTTFAKNDTSAFDGYATRAKTITKTVTATDGTTSTKMVYIDAQGLETSTPSNVAYEPINYEGTTKEQRNLYDYAVSLTQSYFQGTTGLTDIKKGSTALKTASDSDNTSAISYYTNLFNRMQSGGYFCYTQTYDKTLATKNIGNYSHYIYTDSMDKTVINDSALFSEKLKNGELAMEYYSSANEGFISTSLDDDETVTEVKDETSISRAETKYEQDLTALEQKDKKFDLELKKLDTEHSALQTEYDSVKSVIQKNVENSFKTFG